jgi:hypothetical protein
MASGNGKKIRDCLTAWILLLSARGAVDHAATGPHNEMKRAVGSILCIVAILGIVGLMIGPPADTTAHLVQHWAAIGVFLAIGLALSAGKKPQSSGADEATNEPADLATAPRESHLAKGSWLSSVMVILLLIFVGRVGGVFVEIIAFLFLISGFSLGIFALVTRRKRKGILGHALIGITMNGLLLFIFITNFLAANAKARQSRSTASLSVVEQAGPRKASDPSGRLSERIIQTHRRIIVDTNQAELIWSDGALLEVGGTLSTDLQQLVSRTPYHHDIGSFVEQLKSANAWREATVVPNKSEDRTTMIKSADGKISVMVDPLYLEYLAQRYPGANIKIRGRTEPIIFVVGGKIRASLMPIKLER